MEFACSHVVCNWRPGGAGELNELTLEDLSVKSFFFNSVFPSFLNFLNFIPVLLIIFCCLCVFTILPNI